MSKKPIKIGYSLSLSGILAANGKTAFLAYKLWEENVNINGGFLGRYANKSLEVDKIDLNQIFFVAKKFRKRQYFLQKSEICKYTSFIIRGAIRQHRVDEKGEEHIINLFIENWWASDRESLMNQTPSKYFIDAWEDIEILLVKKEDLVDLMDRIPILSEWIRKLDSNFAKASEKRIYAAISLSAKDHNYNLGITNSEFLQRFSPYIIASYLGVN